MIRAHRQLVEEAIAEQWPAHPMTWSELQRLRAWLDTVPDADQLMLCALIHATPQRPPTPISRWLARRWFEGGLRHAS